MNSCFLTIQIISQPQLININSTELVIISGLVPSNIKGMSFFKVKLYFDKFLYKNFFYLYKTYDCIFIRGNIYFKSNNKNKKYIEIYLQEVQLHINNKNIF